MMVGTIKTKTTGGMATHTQEIVENLRDLDIKILYYKINPHNVYFKMYDYFIKIVQRTFGLSIKLLKDARKVDIIHVQASGPIGGILPAITGAFWKKILNFNLIVTFHFSKTASFFKRYQSIGRFVLESADKFIVVSNKQRNDISSIVGKQFIGKISVIPNGYNPEKLRLIDKKVARERLNLEVDDKILVNIGLLFEKKGQKYLINSMNELTNVKNYGQLKCFIIGQGPLLNRLQKQIRESNLEDHVKLLGFVSLEDLNLYLNSADIFVLPSLDEGNPTVMFEALSLGLPFIGTEVGGIPEIITSDEYGLIVKPSNSKLLTENIIMALEKDWNDQKIRQYAEQFVWKNIAKQTVEVYNKLLKK